VCKIDVTTCDRCGGNMRVIAFITHPPVVRRILDHTGLPAQPPAVAPARGPPQTDFHEWQGDTYADPPASD
jgi:hypothetical protein